MEQIQGDRAAAETLNLLAHLGEYETLVQGRQEFVQEVFPADARSL